MGQTKDWRHETTVGHQLSVDKTEVGAAVFVLLCCSFGQERVSNGVESRWRPFIDVLLRMKYGTSISISLRLGGVEKGNFRSFNVAFDDGK